MTVSSPCNKVHILLNLVKFMTYFNFYFDYIATAEWPLLCLTDHSVRYIIFHSVLVFLATLMCYIPFEKVCDVD